jgi:capsular polysaccharide transport system permease protein
MLDVDNFNPLNRFLLKKNQLATVAEGGDLPSSDSKVVPIKPPRIVRSRLSGASVTQVLLIPIAVAGLYFYGIARDRYVTRSDFVIRKAEDTESPLTGNGLANLLSRGNQLSIEDARFLKTYLQSPQVLADLRRSFDLDSAYARNRVDPFAGIPPGLSSEKKLRFFKKQVAVSLDEISGAIVLRTVGLTPEASYRLNKFMLAKSEEFVNRLNQDISVKQSGFAEKELERSRANLNLAKDRLIRYQQSNIVIDPKGETELAVQTIGKLQEKLIELRVQLATLKLQFKDPQEPDVASVRDQVRELEGQIEKERRSVVSSKGKNLTKKNADIIKLESDVVFAADSYKLALAAVEKTRVESKRQQKFMAVLSLPQQPEDPENDWKSKGLFTVVATCAVGFSLTKFVLGMQASHRQ